MLFAAVFAATPEDWRALDPHRVLRMMRPSHQPTAAQMEAALSGQILTGIQQRPGGGVPEVWALALVEQPIERVWSAVNDELHRPGPSELTTVLQGQACASPRVIFQMLPIPVPFVSDRWWTVRLVHNRDLYDRSQGSMWEMVWHREEASSLLPATLQEQIEDAEEILLTQGSWLLLRLGEELTMIEYAGATDPGVPIPEGVGGGISQRGIEKTMKAVRAMSAQPPACGYRPDGSPSF